MHHPRLVSTYQGLCYTSRPNAGGEGCISQLCMLTVLLKGHPYDLRWHLFCKHLAESSKLPPTVAAPDEYIERV